MDVQLKSYLGIDLGTSSVKVGLFDSSMSFIGGESSEYGIHYPSDGGAEQSPEEWWDAIVKASGALREKYPDQWKAINGLSVTGQFSGTIPVDSRGKPLRDAIIWLDSRGENETKRIISGFPGIQGYRIDRLYRWISLTGGAPTRSGKDSISHILYLKAEEKDTFARTFMFLEPKDYINFRLTGKMFGTYDSMVLHWITDNRSPTRIVYSDLLLKYAGLERSRFPDLVGSWEKIGNLNGDSRESLGIGDSIPVAGGSGDIQSAIVGSGCFQPYEPILYIGTSSWVSCHVPSKKTDIFHNIAALPSALPGKYFVAAEQESAGSALAHVRKILYDGPGISSFSEIDRLAESAPAGSDGLIFMPWLYGERAPVESRWLRSSFFNMSLNHGRQHLARSVLEGVAYNTRWLLGVVEKFVGRTFPYLIMSGGGALSDLWAGIMSDVLEREVRALSDPVYVNARGAAILSAMAGSNETGIDLDRNGLVRKTFTPDQKTFTTHRKNYETFLRFYRDNRKSMSVLNR